MSCFSSADCSSRRRFSAVARSARSTRPARSARSARSLIARSLIARFRSRRCALCALVNGALTACRFFELLAANLESLIPRSSICSFRDFSNFDRVRGPARARMMLFNSSRSRCSLFSCRSSMNSLFLFSRLCALDSSGRLRLLALLSRVCLSSSFMSSAPGSPVSMSSE